MKVLLSNLIPETKMVDVGRGEVEVFGLDLTHIGILLSKYEQELSGFFADVESGNAEKLDIQKLASSLPDVMNEVIAMGIHAEDQMEEVKRIPLSAKVEILSGIWELSVTDSKKLVAKLQELSASATTLRKSLGA